MIFKNSPVEMPLLAYKKRFWGLPKGVKREPLMAAMFSRLKTGRMYFSLLPALKRIIVSGTKIIRETSLVTNIEVKKTENTRKIVSDFRDESFFSLFVRA